MLSNCPGLISDVRNIMRNIYKTKNPSENICWRDFTRNQAAFKIKSSIGKDIISGRKQRANKNQCKTLSPSAPLQPKNLGISSDLVNFDLVNSCKCFAIRIATTAN